jgi:hypothetical protein
MDWKCSMNWRAKESILKNFDDETIWKAASQKSKKAIRG